MKFLEHETREQCISEAMANLIPAMSYWDSIADFRIYLWLRHTEIAILQDTITDEMAKIRKYPLREENSPGLICPKKINKSIKHMTKVQAYD